MGSVDELKKKFGEVIVDSENNCIDRSTPLGKYFDDALEAARNEKDENRSAFMQQVLAYTEASLVIEATMEPEDAKKALDQLKKNMEDSTAK